VLEDMPTFYIESDEFDERIELEVPTGCLVETAKEILAAKVGWRQSDMRLFFCGRELGDQWTLNSYNLWSDRTLHLSRATVAGSEHTPAASAAVFLLSIGFGGNWHQICVTADDCITDVKDKVRDLPGAPAVFELWMGQYQLDSRRRLRDYDIVDELEPLEAR
jgi:hypothetical protein